jgi:hypothetical protein
MPVVVGWGSNSSGQINTPSDLVGVTQVVCGGSHTYALKNDGTLVGWGSGFSGTSNTPSDLVGVTQVACGFDYTYALKNDGTLIGWGNNDKGQIDTPSNTVVITQLASGYQHTYAIFEGDCDADGVLDRTTVASGTVPDLNANVVPDDCDLARGWEEDCDTNTVIDSYQQGVNLPFLVQSAQFGPIGAGSPRMAEVAAPPFTLSDPVLTLTVRGDFSLPSEFVTVYLNGRFVGQVFTDTGSDKNDCRSITRQITLSRAFYNEMIDQGGGATAAAFEFVPSIAVNANQCPTGSWIRCDLSYTAAITGDCNANGLLDACETRDFPDTDTNGNGIVDTCENYSLVFLCPGDLDGGGSVDTADLSLLLMSFGAAMPGNPADLDGDQNINTADLSLMLLNFGDC